MASWRSTDEEAAELMLRRLIRQHDRLLTRTVFRTSCAWLMCAAWTGAVMMSTPGLRAVLVLAGACMRAILAAAASARRGREAGAVPHYGGQRHQTRAPGRGWKSNARRITAGAAGEALINAWCELAAGLLAACAVAMSPLCVVLALCLLTPLRRSAAYARLADSARTDPKTGLLNYASWRHAAAVELARAARTQCPTCILMLDLDHFKAVNDRCGHLAGDQALGVVAGLLRAQLRQYDLAGRFGGEEFVVMLPQTGVTQALQIAQRLRSAVAEARVDTIDVRASEVNLRVTISIGVAIAESADLDAILTAADSACYQAKMAGRNRVRLWPYELRPGNAPQARRPARQRAR
jgi:diguanylate cyclase (GGDEF)-like protein